MQTSLFSPFCSLAYWRHLLAALTLLLVGCGGGGSAELQPIATATNDETGTLVISLTDAAEDFVSYSVDVRAIRLETAGGRVVDTLPLSTRVDFAELTEVTELLTVATVPVGVYESVSLTLDFTDAEILVQDADGDVVAAQAQDDSGELLQELTVRLSLTSSDVIRIRRGIPAAFSLDFDLAASNEIDLSVEPAVVTVFPFLLATPELEADRVHRVRGLLESADSDTQEITVKVRPFHHRTGEFGTFTFKVTDATAYEVDGEVLDAAEGLDAVAALAVNTPIVAGGMAVAGDFVADRVLAGTSVPGSQWDVVKGVVTARSDDVLTVRGARLLFRDGKRIIRDGFRVVVGSETQVNALGAMPGTFSSQSISVGQRIVAFGEFDADVNTSVLDVTAGRVRMNISSLSGEVIAADPLVVDLHLLSGRRPTAFDFSGTGILPEYDANPARYEIATQTLPLSNIEADDIIRVRGLVNEFGAAPDDFIARTLISHETDTRPASFVALWPIDETMAIAEISELAVLLDLTAARIRFHVLGRSMNDILLTSLNLVAPASGRGAYAVRVRGQGEIHLYRSFAELTADLLRQLDAGNQLRRTAAHGRYNGSDELEAVRASFEFIPPTQ